MYVLVGNAAQPAVSSDPVAQVWNPHSTHRCRLVRLAVAADGVGTSGNFSSILFRRSTARGTAGSTVTPDIDHHSERAIAPPSGVVLDLAAFSVLPTMGSSIGPGAIISRFAGGTGLIFALGVVVPPGTGLVLESGGNGMPACRITVEAEEDW